MNYYGLKSDLNIFNKIYTSIPSFDDIFDEQTFYLFALFITFVTIIAVVILSRFITLKEID